MTPRLNKWVPRSVLERVAPVWIICLMVGSLMPGNAKVVIGSTRLSDQGKIQASRQTGERKHRMFHVVSFGATVVLFLLLARKRTEVVYAIGGSLAFGLVIEISEMLLYRNRFEWEDVRDDCYGVLAGTVLMFVWAIAERALPQRNELVPAEAIESTEAARRDSFR